MDVDFLLIGSYIFIYLLEEEERIRRERRNNRIIGLFIVLFVISFLWFVIR